MHDLDLLAFLLGAALLLGAARAGGEVAKRFGQPEVLGQLVAGVLLGPSLLGALGPVDTLLHGGVHAVALETLAEIGALLLLLAAGMEVDLREVRAEARLGLWVAAAAIVPSIAAGPLLAVPLFGVGVVEGLFLGVVLSVTALSVAGQVFIDQRTVRRRYAQLVLAAGVVAEVAVWLLVAVVSAVPSGRSPVREGALSIGAAALVLAVAVGVGRPLVPRLMRLAADRLRMRFAQVSLVLLLLLLFAAGTEALGLHSLLGAFVLGVLLHRAPRVDHALTDRLELLTLGVFAPLFFVLAGSRVDLGSLADAGAGPLALLFLGAVAVKVVPVVVVVAAKGLRPLEALTVGVGLSVRGGTDIVVAILGFGLGILSEELFAAYTLVALLSVLLAPTALRLLGRVTPARAEEEVKLRHEEAESRSYVPRLQRVVVPTVASLRPSLAADVVEHLALARFERDHIVDVTELSPAGSGSEGGPVARLAGLGAAKGLRVTSRRLRTTDPAELLRSVAEHDLVVVGVEPGQPGGHLGALQETVVEGTGTDVLLVASHDRRLPWSRIRRVLVPVNGLDHAMAAADVAGHLAEACGAELVAVAVVRPEQRRTRGAADGVARLAELRFRMQRLPITFSTVVREGVDPARLLLEEVERGEYDLVVLGGLDRTGDGSAWLGPTIGTMLELSPVPCVVLVQHAGPAGGTPTAARTASGAEVPATTP